MADALTSATSTSTPVEVPHLEDYSLVKTILIPANEDLTIITSPGVTVALNEVFSPGAGEETILHVTIKGYRRNP